MSAPPTDAEGSRLQDCALIAFVPATDLARSRAFYADVLGLALVEETPFACVFEAHGTMLRVTATTEPARPGYTVLGWRVRGIEGLVTRLGRAGVTFVHFDGLGQDRQGIWATPGGDRVAWFRDPDGNTLSLTEFADPVC